MAVLNKGLIGKEDISWGSGTFTRGDDTMTSINLGSLSLNVYSASDYGAVGDGQTDDTAAIQAALDAAATVVPGPSGDYAGATVLLPGPQYLISDTITVPSLVSLVGAGKTIITTTTSGLAKMISVDESNADGNRYGRVENLYLDGNSNAVVGMYVGLAVQRSFRNISVEGCTDAGWVIDSTQNCEFISCDAENNGAAASTFGCGMRLNHGAGSNAFLRCEVSANIPYGVVILDNDTADSTKTTGFPTGPSGNTFYRCLIERPDGTSGVNQIYIRAGRFNQFANCTVSATGLTAAFTAVNITQEDKALDSTKSTGPVYFTGGDSGGTASQTTAFALVGSGGNSIYCYVDGMFFENHLTAFSSDTYCRMVPGPRNHFGGSITNLYSGSGALDTVTDSSIHRFKMYSSREAGSETSLSADVDGDTVPRFRLLASGAMQWGAGNASTDVQLGRVAANVLGLSSGDSLGVGVANANTATPSGATAYAVPIYSSAGALLGYIPVYAAEWS